MIIPVELMRELTKLALECDHREAAIDILKAAIRNTAGCDVPDSSFRPWDFIDLPGQLVCWQPDPDAWVCTGGPLDGVVGATRIPDRYRHTGAWATSTGAWVVAYA